MENIDTALTVETGLMFIYVLHIILHVCHEHIRTFDEGNHAYWLLVCGFTTNYLTLD